MDQNLSKLQSLIYVGHNVRRKLVKETKSMQKKRLEEALNAGKLIRLGFDLNNCKPEKLKLLYHVNCFTNNVTYKAEANENESHANLEVQKESEPAGYHRDEDEKVEILSVQFNSKLNLIATGDSNGYIQIHDIFTGIPVTAEKDDDNLESPRDSLFATLKEGLVKKNPNTIGYNMPVISMKWSTPNAGILFFAHVNGFVGLLDRDTMKKLILIEENDEIACIDVCADSSLLAMVGKDYCLKIFDVNLNSMKNLGRKLRSYGCENVDVEEEMRTTASMHTSRLQCVKFSNCSSDILFTGGWDRTVKIWDKRTSNGIVNTIYGPFICGSDAIDVNDNLIMTASWVKENALQLWDMRNCRKVYSQLAIKSDQQNVTDFKSRKSGEFLYACKFYLNSSNDKNENLASYSTVLACGSGTQSLHLIDYEDSANGRQLASIDCNAPLYCLDSMRSCSLIACGSMKKYFMFMSKPGNETSSSPTSTLSSTNDN